MREVKFRGKAKMTTEELNGIGIEHKSGWVFGNLISNGDKPVIVGDIADWGDDYIAHEWFVAVELDSVGQYTGLKDTNGVEIYEGDIWQYSEGRAHLIEFEEGRAGWYPFADGDGCGCCSDEVYYPSVGKVIGNMRENPELLEASE